MTQPEIDRAIQRQVDWITDQAVVRNPSGPSREVVAGIAAIGIDRSVRGFPAGNHPGVHHPHLGVADTAAFSGENPDLTLAVGEL